MFSLLGFSPLVCFMCVSVFIFWWVGDFFLHVDFIDVFSDRFQFITLIAQPKPLGSMSLNYFHVPCAPFL